MSSVLDEVLTIQYYNELLPAKSLPQIIQNDNEDEFLVDQLIDRCEQLSCKIYGNVQSGAPIVIWFGHRQTSLREKLITHLVVHDIVLILFLSEEHLWQWLESNSTVTVASLVLQASTNSQALIFRSHTYDSIRSILVRCETNELINLHRFARRYPKIDGIYDDDPRILIKLVFDLTLISEELGDQQREDNNNEMEAQRNYDRALKLCALVKTF